MKKVIQWVLSKIFPYNTESISVNGLNMDSAWDNRKHAESEEFYGGNDGTGRY